MTKAAIGDLIVEAAMAARMSFAAFAAFYDGRPEGERWELIDGAATRLAARSIVHQRIAKNLQKLLNAQLTSVRPGWHAEWAAGVRDPEIDGYALHPDLSIGPLTIQPNQIWTECFYFVVEIAESRELRYAKEWFYLSHKHCRGLLVVSHEDVSAELVSRVTRGVDEWTSQTLSVADVIDIPDIGAIGRLGDAYADTHLEVSP